MTSELYLLIFFLVFFLIVFVIRSYLLWKSSGINPLTFDNSDDAHGFNGKVFKSISYFELAIVAVNAIKNDWYQYYLPFWYLEHPVLEMIGWGFCMVLSSGFLSPSFKCQIPGE